MTVTVPVSTKSDALFRDLLEALRGALHALEGSTSPELSVPLGGVLEALETTLIDWFGWDYPEPLSGNDVAFLAELDDARQRELQLADEAREQQWAEAYQDQPADQAGPPPF